MNKRCSYPLFLLLIFLSWSCTKKQSTKEKKAAVVKVTQAIMKDIPYYISTVGHIEAFKTVDIMAQVNGYLMETYFEDGAYVKNGDLLYLIDQRPYVAELQKAEASLEQNVANLKYAKRTAERNTPLAKDAYISQETYDNLITNVIVDDSVVKKNMADVETAKINLDFTTIYAPMDARAGASIVKNGNLVLESAETKLVTLNQIVPIYATFFVSEKDLSTIQRYQKQFGELKTFITTEDPNTPPYEGALTFIDNAVDLATGMVKMKAAFPNDDKSLWPNQYIHVQVNLDTIKGGILVPLEAVQESPKGKYVFVVKRDKTVEMRFVKVGQLQKNLIVIEEGLKEGEQVVIVGQINLYPGARIITQTGDNK